MQLHQLQPIPRRKNKKRVGRGGKRGTYSGRGQKGQRARSGHRIRPASRDLIQKLPKLRGIKHKSLNPKAIPIRLGDLDRLFKGGDEVNAEILRKFNLAKKRFPIKIVSDGEISKSLKIKGLKLSQKAKEKILKAGGTME